MIFYGEGKDWFTSVLSQSSFAELEGMYGLKFNKVFLKDNTFLVFREECET